jgi:hypothetical protein
MSVQTQTEQWPPPLRRLPVPVAEPFPLRRLIVEEDYGVAATQGTLALALPHEPRVRDEAGDPDERTPLPEPRAWATRFVQAAVEVAAGARSPGQLARWSTLEVHAMLTRRALLSLRVRRGSDRPAGRVAVRTVRTCRPRDGVCEASAVVMDGDRIRAVALRMEGTRGRWQVIAMELG